jgi:hypothetical protein
MTNPTGRTALQRVECERGFVIEAVDQGVVDAAGRYRHDVHGIDLTADFVSTVARPVPDRPPRRTEK